MHNIIFVFILNFVKNCSTTYLPIISSKLSPVSSSKIRFGIRYSPSNLYLSSSFLSHSSFNSPLVEHSHYPFSPKVFQAIHVQKLTSGKRNNFSAYITAMQFYCFFYIYISFYFCFFWVCKKPANMTFTGFYHLPE